MKMHWLRVQKEEFECNDRLYELKMTCVRKRKDGIANGYSRNETLTSFSTVFSLWCCQCGYFGQWERMNKKRNTNDYYYYYYYDCCHIVTIISIRVSCWTVHDWEKEYVLKVKREWLWYDYEGGKRSCNSFFSSHPCLFGSVDSNVDRRRWCCCCHYYLRYVNEYASVLL